MKKLTSIACALLLSACATITDGGDQPVRVETNPPVKGTCTLSNDKGTWQVNPPGAATVRGASGALSVACKGTLNAGKKTKSMAGSATIESATKAATFGNILVGGIIGAAVDMSSGAAYRYPAAVIVPMSEELNVAGGVEQ